jgi:uncharacterized Zn finger protein
MSENSRAKARRILAEGRVMIHCVEDGRVVASVRGDAAADYSVRLDAGVWSCSCPAVESCSHAQAVQFVTAPYGVTASLFT